MSTSNYFSSLLKQCYETHSHIQTKKLHCLIIKTTKNPETILLNNLISAYFKNINFSYARKVFDKIAEPNQYSWNTMLLVYSKSKNIAKMEEFFKLIPRKDKVSWNLFISGYVSSEMVGEAIESYRGMLREGVGNLNRISVSTMLSLSSKKNKVRLGRQVHGQVVKFGFCSYAFVGSALVDMYAKFGLAWEAKRVFDELPEKNDSVSWTTMISGLMQNGLYHQAIETFQQMRFVGCDIDQFTFGSTLTACGGIMAVKEGKQIHAFVIRSNHIDNMFVGSAIVDMYSKCSSMVYAERVFSRMRNKNVVSWTAMLVGYGQNGYSQEAVTTFYEMQRSGIEPDEYTFGSVISSCSNLASLEEGTQCHGLVMVSGLAGFLVVSNALITLYGKCGNLDDAQRLFNEIKLRDQVSWTALLSGYAQFGKAKEAIYIFEEMLTIGQLPDAITFIGVLSACSRAGLVDEGRLYYNSMVEKYGISPGRDHQNCMIDLFSRSGCLDEAKKFIQNMPYQPDVFGWVTILSSCRNLGNIEIGKWAGESLLELEPLNPAGYILLSSIYSAKGKWDEVAHLRRGMRDKRVRKEPGYSWIRYKNRIHVFSADDKSSPYLDKIYAELEVLHLKMVKDGYNPNLSSDLHDMDESEKMKALRYHSERLAIAFGLIYIPLAAPIRVMKNLRVCDDCHSAIKIISKITKREILVRDSVRFHLFKGGYCSCGDFW
ncbi:hypothetical protein LIER_14586 [Lithospermum erythrorhizon]|uniref:DYW domain-containing protein n=1 Tax=Lithospermum erythrorhizon TaxID=34254 RepID=A0AAV3Q185_LITER